MTARAAAVNKGDQSAREPAGRGPRVAPGPPLSSKVSKTSERAHRADESLRAVLYDASGEDREVRLTANELPELGESQLLWIDIDTTRRKAVPKLTALLKAKGETAVALSPEAGSAAVRDYGRYFSIGIPVLAADTGQETVQLQCLASHGWVVTTHHGDAAFIPKFADHLRGDSELGQLDAPSFLANLLEWELNDYFQAVERVHADIDDIEDDVLAGQAAEEVLTGLVTLRRHATRLRRSLTAQRPVFATLAHPGFHLLSDSEAAQDFALLSDRLEQAVQATDNAREMAIGAFDVLMTRTSQRTNDIMKVLTVVSVLLLPPTLVAGILGMNMLPKYLLQPLIFWLAMGVMTSVDVGVLWLLRRRGWL